MSMNFMPSIVVGALLLVGAWSVVQEMRFRIRNTLEQTIPVSGFRLAVYDGILAILTASFLFQVRRIFPDFLVIGATLLLAFITVRQFSYAQRIRSPSGPQTRTEQEKLHAVEIRRVNVALWVRLILVLLCAVGSVVALVIFSNLASWGARIGLALISLGAMIGSTAFWTQMPVLDLELRRLQGKIPREFSC